MNPMGTNSQLMFASPTRHFTVVRGTVPTFKDSSVLKDSGHMQNQGKEMRQVSNLLNV